MLAECEEVTAVISLDVPEEEIVQRIAGRWTHIKSGRVYNTTFNPPKIWVNTAPIHICENV